MVSPSELNIIELIVFLLLGLSEVVGFIFALREFNKRKISPVFLIACVNLCVSAFGFCFFFGRLYSNYLLIVFGLIQINLVCVLVFAFVREMFGSRRRYALLHYLQIIFFTLAVYFTVESPPIFEPERIVFPLAERISIIEFFSRNLSALFIEFSRPAILC